MKSKTNKIWILSILVALLTICALISPVLADDASTSSSSSSSNSYTITCKYPGQVVEAGATVSYSLIIKNTGSLTYAQKLRVDSFKGEEDWKFEFFSGTTKIDRIALGTGESETITLKITTSGDSKIDTYPVKVSAYDGSIWLYVIVEKTHAGENGVLKLKVVNEQGEIIKGAAIAAYIDRPSQSFETYDARVYSASDGTVRTEIAQNDYILLVSKDGYVERKVSDVTIQSGYEKDLGTVMLERKNFGLSIDVKNPVVTTTLDSNPVYELTLTNVGKSDDTFMLEYSGMPDDWYGRYKETADSKSELSELFLSSGASKTIFLEVITPYSLNTGEYVFNADIISSSDGTVNTKSLKATIKGSSDLQVFADKYLYELTKGDTLDIPIKIINNGNGVALTNVQIGVSASDGWSVTKSPETIAGIAPGEKETVTLKVVPPASIAASEYKITVKVTSDQGEVTDSIKISVKENSLVGLFGLILILCAIGGVWYMYRKYQRR